MHSRDRVLTWYEKDLWPLCKKQLSPVNQGDTPCPRLHGHMLSPLPLITGIPRWTMLSLKFRPGTHPNIHSVFNKSAYQRHGRTVPKQQHNAEGWNGKVTSLAGISFSMKVRKVLAQQKEGPQCDPARLLRFQTPGLRKPLRIGSLWRNKPVAQTR